MNIKTLYQTYLAYSSISTDSRTVQKGDLFFALSGNNFDGNQFAKSAIEKGAKYAIVDKPCEPVSDQYIVVDDVLKTLQELATYHIEQLNIPIIAITGTNGKTTTKELVHAVLQSAYQTTATVGNLNNHIGVPLTLLRMNKQTEVGVVEMGANHPKEIQMLCEIAKPTHGIITNVGMAHLEGFKDFSGVIHTKKELYDYIKENNGKVIINQSDELLSDMLGNYPSFAFAKDSKAPLIINNIQSTPYLTFEWKSEKTSSSLETHLIGEYHVANVAYAIAVGLLFNIQSESINKAIESYIPLNNRSQIIHTENHNKIWLDAYNANPTSMTAAIMHFAKVKDDNKVLIIGEMLELGSYSEKEHRKILDLIDEHQFSTVYLVGGSFKELASDYRYQYFENTALLEEALQSNPLIHKHILIKGSRGNHLETVVQYL